MTLKLACVAFIYKSISQMFNPYICMTIWSFQLTTVFNLEFDMSNTFNKIMNIIIIKMK